MVYSLLGFCIKRMFMILSRCIWYTHRTYFIVLYPVSVSIFEPKLKWSHAKYQMISTHYINCGGVWLKRISNQSYLIMNIPSIELKHWQQTDGCQRGIFKCTMCNKIIPKLDRRRLVAEKATRLTTSNRSSKQNRPVPSQCYIVVVAVFIRVSSSY